MLHTFQGSYEPMRSADITEGNEDTQLDGATAGYTYHWSDRPALKEVYRLGEEANGAVIIATSPVESTADALGCFKLYGYPEGGPAEFMCDISCAAGTARINDDAEALYVDTMNIGSQGHIKNLSVDDSGNNRVAKLSFDTTGLRYLYMEWYDISMSVRAHIRVF